MNAEITPIRQIETEQDYDAALAEACAMMETEAGTPEAARLNALARQIEEYEARPWPIVPSALPDDTDCRVS